MTKQTTFKLEKRDSVWLQNNSAPVNIEYAKTVNDVAILPIGAIEQHAAHCPTGMDSFNAIGLAEKIAEKSGATVLPCPMYGGHPYMHMGMPGTIALNYETNIMLIHDIIAGAANMGFNKFIIHIIKAIHKNTVGKETAGLMDIWLPFLSGIGIFLAAKNGKEMMLIRFGDYTMYQIHIKD